MEYDYIIIGSGFGSSVSALRLTEKGYKVLVIEKGKRYYPKDFAKTNWNLPKWLWAPQLFCYGIQKLNLLNDVLILSGTGVGGGSLVYANTLLIPPETYFNDPTWAHLEKNWKNELLPFYKTAQKMLGVVKNPEMSQMDKLLKEYAGEIGRADYFKPTEVGVYFGEPGKTVPDPYFDGKGPARTGCTKTSHCMVGCKDGGKNTLDKNYLYLAEQQGLEILAEHEVTEVRADKDGGYTIIAQKVTDFLFKRKKTFKTKGVVFAAGVMGTMELMMTCKAKGHLRNLSEKLGHMVRTNSEVLTGFTA
ncbi:MAG: GMC family oxidoreductase, partial [bacterium]|nr:GMC family oxidoreductase [bacterium]